MYISATENRNYDPIFGNRLLLSTAYPCTKEDGGQVRQEGIRTKAIPIQLLIACFIPVI